jgi:hypothetical protein
MGFATSRLTEIAKHCFADTWWIEDKDQPHDIDHAFLGWAKKFTKGKPPS